MAYFAQLHIGTYYWTGIFPAEIVFGLGLGAVFGTCINMATAGATAETAGVASALVTTGQQVGGSIGTSLLNTIATSAAATYLADHATRAYLASHVATITRTPVYAAAQTHSYAVCFYIAAGIILVTAVGAGALYPPGRRRPEMATGEVAIA
jgi:hypothetical protein